MKKCHECGETKGLKQIVLAYCDNDEHNHSYNGYRGSICRSCYVMCACDEDSHNVDTCLTEPDCPNHKKSVEFCTNWDNYNYHWKLKEVKLS